MDAVTEILLERSQQADRVSRMVVLSLVAHGVLITAIAFAPTSSRSSAENLPVMTIPFGGLATGGGGAGQAYTDYADFCCPEYLRGVTDLIRKNWNSKQGQDGAAIIKFTIKRDGTITDVLVEQGSNQLLNLAAQRAIAITQRVPALPAAFTPPQLTLHLVFQYQR